jgi:ATP-dependent Zn protease
MPKKTVMSKRKASTLAATAYHEAGHAVACFVMRAKVKTATILPSEDYSGRVRHENMFRGNFGQTST